MIRIKSMRLLAICRAGAKPAARRAGPYTKAHRHFVNLFPLRGGARSARHRSMQISCPSCAATYDVPVILLTMPRTMRCAVCAQDFRTEAVDQDIVRAELARAAAPPAPPLDAIAPAADDPALADLRALAAIAEPEAPAPDQPAPRAGPSPGPRRIPPVLISGTVPAALGWVLSIAGLYAGGAAVIENRAGIVHAWPASLRLFQWMGLG